MVLVSIEMLLVSIDMWLITPQELDVLANLGIYANLPVLGTCSFIDYWALGLDEAAEKAAYL